MANSQKIGINTLFMVPNQTGGTEYHLRSTLKYLEQLDQQHDYLVFCNKENFSTFTFQSPRWQKICCPVRGANRVARVLYEQLFLPADLIKHACTLSHSFGYSGLLFSNLPQVMTVHDANWLDHPEDLGGVGKLAVQFLTEQSMRRCAVICTDSDFSRKRLIKYFPQYQSKIQVVSPGVDDDFVSALYQKRTQPYKNKHYLLSINAFYPHKKVDYLLTLWQQISSRHPQLYLVIVGQHGLSEKSVLSQIQSLPNITHYPKVSFPKLVSLYQSAEMCLMPSIYEGFGYPVYEAVAAQKTVLVGKKALYDRRIRSALQQLTFSVTKDVQLVEKMLRQSRLPKKIKYPILSYTPGIKKLLNIYNSL